MGIAYGLRPEHTGVFTVRLRKGGIRIQIRRAGLLFAHVKRQCANSRPRVFNLEGRRDLKSHQPVHVGIEIARVIWQFCSGVSMGSLGTWETKKQDTMDNCMNPRDPNQDAFGETTAQSVQMLRAVINGETYEAVAAKFGKSRTAVERRTKGIAAPLYCSRSSRVASAGNVLFDIG